MQKEHLGFLFGFFAAISSAMSALLIKWTQEVNNETMVFARFSICLLFFLPRILQGRISLHFKNIRTHLLRSLAGLGSVYCYFYSVEHLPLVNAVTISNTFILFLPIIVFFWSRLIIPKMRLLAILIGFLGILLILRPSLGLSEVANLVGLVGSVLSAIAIFGIRQLSKVETTETILSYYFFFSAIVSFFPMVAAWKPVAQPILWLNLALIGLFSFSFQYCLTKSLTHAPATKVSTLNYLNVVFSGALGWWFFAEMPTLWVLGGSALIIVGGIIALLSKESSRPWGKKPVK